MNELSVFEKITNPIEACETMGKWIASSQMFGCTKPEQGMVLALACMCEKKNPIELSRTYHIINNRLSMKSDAMLAAFRRLGGKVTWLETTDKICKAEWDLEGKKTTISFSIEDAQRAQLVKSGGNWEKYPDAMLRARCISKAVRMIAPEVNAGVYTPEEIEDASPPRQAPQIVSITKPAETTPQAFTDNAQSEPGAAEPLRKQDVADALRAHATKHGVEPTKLIIKKVTGVESLNDIPDSMYEPLVKALS